MSSILHTGFDNWLAEESVLQRTKTESLLIFVSTLLRTFHQFKERPKGLWCLLNFQMCCSFQSTSAWVRHFQFVVVGGFSLCMCSCQSKTNVILFFIDNSMCSFFWPENDSILCWCIKWLQILFQFNHVPQFLTCLENCCCFSTAEGQFGLKKEPGWWALHKAMVKPHCQLWPKYNMTYCEL